jgi:ornithine cyclodeaminase/alanine dehydrogenase-like protein (mu-crystallin family)
VTLLLDRADVIALLSMQDCVEAVERAFRRLGEGEIDPPAMATVRARGGAFHVKAGRIGDRFAAKINANFFEAVPRIQGLVVLGDATDGRMLAVMDSIEITALRTAAATAVAARLLARPDARTALVVGCGKQGRAQLEAVRLARSIERVYAMDTDPDAARAFARDTGAEIVDAPVEADVVVTCTPSRTPILHRAARGAFVAAVGADSPEKREMGPGLMASAKVVTDVTEQCVAIGDLHHAVVEGRMTREGVHAELGEIVAGKRPGRESDDEVVVFDSTGMALQDVAAAAAVFEKARASGRGRTMTFA